MESKERLIRITAAGGEWRTANVIDVESGQTIHWVQSLDIHLEGGIDPPKATLTIVAPSLDVTTWATVQQATWLAALYKQLEEARAIIEELDTEHPLDAPKAAAREWLEKYPKDEVAGDGK